MYPILFHIGTFPVRSFGVMMVIAFLLSIQLAQARAPKFGMDKNAINDLSFWALIAGVFGARIVYILQELPYYMAHKNELFSIQFSGLTSFGGLLFGLAAALIWAIKRGVGVLNLIDLLAPCFLVGHIFGRIGCFLNGCCYGHSCDAHEFLAFKFAGLGGYHIGAQLIDAAMNIVALGLVLLIERKHLALGRVFGLTFILHGITRIIYEIWRAGTPAEVETGIASSTYWGTLPFTQAQAMAFVLVVVGAIIYAIAPKFKPKAPVAEAIEVTPANVQPQA